MFLDVIVKRPIFLTTSSYKNQFIYPKYFPYKLHKNALNKDT